MNPTSCKTCEIARPDKLRNLRNCPPLGKITGHISLVFFRFNAAMARVKLDPRLLLSLVPRHKLVLYGSMQVKKTAGELPN